MCGRYFNGKLYHIVVYAESAIVSDFSVTKCPIKQKINMKSKTVISWPTD